MKKTSLMLVKSCVEILGMIFGTLFVIMLVIGIMNNIIEYNSISGFVSSLFSFSLYNFWFWFDLICASVFLYKHKSQVDERNKIIANGRKYDSRIVDITVQTNVGGMRGWHFYYLDIELETGKKITSPAYLDNPDRWLRSKKCTVYELDGKYHICDFDMYPTDNMEENKILDVEYENCLIAAIRKSDFKEELFLEKRLSILSKYSNKYLLVWPMPLLLGDGKYKMIAVDIIINSSEIMKVSPVFWEELMQYTKNYGKKRKIESCHEAIEDIRVKTKELMKEYYPSVELIRIDIDSF